MIEVTVWIREVQTNTFKYINSLYANKAFSDSAYLYIRLPCTMCQRKKTGINFILLCHNEWRPIAWFIIIAYLKAEKPADFINKNFLSMIFYN